jgi:hypothetical protein
MENPLRQNFFRAGHAHAGVIVILSLICQVLADASVLPPCALVRSNRSAACGDSHFLGVLFLGALANCYPSQRSGRPNLIYAGAVVLALASHARCWAVACSSDELAS